MCVCVCVCVWCEREKGQEELGGQGSGEGVCVEAEHGLGPGTVHRAESCSECGVGAMIPPPPGGQQAGGNEAAHPLERHRGVGEIQGEATTPRSPVISLACHPHPQQTQAQSVLLDSAKSQSLHPVWMAPLVSCHAMPTRIQTVWEARA